MHDAPGPLRPSQPMLELLRLCRALHAEELARSDARFAEETTLDLGAIHAIESELGATLPDDVLVLLATRAPILACATGIRIDGLLDAAEIWSSHVPEDRVAIAYLNPEPFAAREEDKHGGQGSVVSVARDGADARPNVIMVDGLETSLAILARDNIAVWYRNTEAWMPALQRERMLPLDDPSFQAALVGAVRVPVAPPERFVVHAKFGRGRVVEARAEGSETKLVIDFESAGRKTLLERFVSNA